MPPQIVSRMLNSTANWASSLWLVSAIRPLISRQPSASLARHWAMGEPAPSACSPSSVKVSASAPSSPWELVPVSAAAWPASRSDLRLSSNS